MSKKILKFNIEQKLGELTHAQRAKALKVIPKTLGVSRQTFYLWRTYPIDATQAIDGIALQSMADFFKCEVADLINVDIPKINLDAPIHTKSAIKSRYGLVSA